MKIRQRSWGVLLVGAIAASAVLASCRRSSDRGNPTILPISIVTTSLPDGEEGASYLGQLQVNGGVLPYTWSITAGSLPPPLTLDPGSGAISGTPSTVGIYDFTVEVSDGQPTPDTASAALQILVFSPSGTSTPPSVSVVVPVGTQRDLVDTSYQIFDMESDPVTVAVDLSTDSGVTWGTATEGPGGDGKGPHPSSPTGPQYVFQWDSMSDLGPVRLDTVRIRITPSDQVTGLAGETKDFTVDNRPSQLLFVAGPPMIEGRVGHTATLLGNGDVLIVGGLDSKGAVLGTAEIFDPVTDQFVQATGTMKNPRALHSATLLPDGRVLVAGGVDGSNFEYSSAEVFDPVTGQFQGVGSMTKSRAGQAEVSSSAGVFIIGGQFLSGIIPIYFDEVEEYDPLADVFLPPIAGALQEERSLHHAHELSNGRILLIGGGTGLNLSVEEFDPAQGSSVELSISASAPQVVDHASVLLPDGKALVVGGAPGREVVTINVAYDEAYLYDRTGPVGWRFTDVGPMAHSRHGHTATILTDGRVAVIGGSDNAFLNVGEAELYDPASSSFSTGDVMVTPRFMHASVRLQDGRVLVTGGTADGATALSQTEFFGP